MWMLLVALSCLWLYLQLRRRPGNLPVYPGRIPLLGNLALFLGDSIATAEKIQRISQFALDNGDVALVYAGEWPMYVLSDPDDCGAVLGACLHRPGLIKKVGGSLFGRGLLVSAVSVWKEHRKLINQTFNRQVLDGFMGVFNSQSRRLVREWEGRVGEEAFDALRSLEKNTLETVCLTTAGVDIRDQNESNEKFLLAYQHLLSGVVQRVKNCLLYFDFFYDRSKLKADADRNVSVVNQLTLTVLRRKREERERDAGAGCCGDRSEARFEPFLQHLLASRLSEQDLRDELLNIIVAGYETTSTVLLFCLVLLGTYPRVQDECYREIFEVFGASSRDVTKEDLARLRYVDAVLKETMRVCPVLPLTARVITEDVQLKNAVLRKGYVCLLSLSGAMRHPRHWGADAGRFEPARWLRPERLPRSPNAFAAFGLGRRNCVGRAYAAATLQVSLVHVLRAYRVRADFHRMRLKLLGVTKPADGHHVALLPRRPPPDLPQPRRSEASSYLLPRVHTSMSQ